MNKKLLIILVIAFSLIATILHLYTTWNQINLLQEKYSILESSYIEVSSVNNSLSEEVEILCQEVGELIENKEEQDNLIDKLETENLQLVAEKDEVEKELSNLKYDNLREDLPHYWKIIWDDIYRQGGEISPESVKKINFLLQPTLKGSYNSEVNPLSCFFTSYYTDTSEIDLVAFLRYFPYGEVPYELEEFTELRGHVNWPFEDIAFDEMNVPIHRYKYEEVDNILSEYAGTSPNDLINNDKTIYLKSTDAYYNYTSDFGPGVFKCTGGVVEGNEIRLFDDSSDGTTKTLILIKRDEQYTIKSFYEK